MRVLPSLLLLCLFAGCTLGGEPPAPPVPPAPPMVDDLSTWTVPEMVQEAPRMPQEPRPALKELPPTPAEKVYAYTPGASYAVPVSVGFPLDIVFGRGEQVRTVTDGDRAPQTEGQTRRWEVRQGASGAGDSERHHVFVTVTEPGLKNGLVITTTKKVYHITLESILKSPVRVLRWKESPEPVELTEIATKEPGLLPDPETPTRWHVGYKVTSSRHPAPTWSPRQVVDDGKKTYLIYPEVTLFETVPLVRSVGVNGPALVNSRQYLNVVIVDQLAPHLELRVGIGETADVVTISRAHLRTIHCPGDEACPRWPDAARQLARRTP